MRFNNSSISLSDLKFTLAAERWPSAAARETAFKLKEKRLVEKMQSRRQLQRLLGARRLKRDLPFLLMPVRDCPRRTAHFR